jgi:hypothetical protein
VNFREKCIVNGVENCKNYYLISYGVRQPHIWVLARIAAAVTHETKTKGRFTWRLMKDNLAESEMRKRVKDKYQQ